MCTISPNQPLNPGANFIERIVLSRAAFEKLWQLAYRRGMQRAAGVAAHASNSQVMAANEVDASGERLIGFRMGVDAAASRVRRFMEDGAKDE